MTQSKDKSVKDDKTRKTPSIQAKTKARAQTASGAKAKKAKILHEDVSSRVHVIDETMRLISEKGWRYTRLEDVLTAAEMSEVAFTREFGSLVAVLVAASRRLNAVMLEEKARFSPDETVRDRLFSLLMARFDAARPWASALRDLARSAPYDPVLAATGVKIMMMTSAQALAAAGIRARGPLGFARVNTFMAAVTLPVSRVWLTDESADLDKTMVALDRTLDRVEWLAGKLRPSRYGRATPAAKNEAETSEA